MIGSIHDELLLEGPETRAQEMARILKDVMKRWATGFLILCLSMRR